MDSSTSENTGDPLHYPGEYLRQFTTEVFTHCGVPEQDARQAADVLCTADEWGIKSHGVARLRSYYEMLSLGHINHQATPRIVRESPSVAVLDGDNGLGLVVGPQANGIAMQKAVETGAAWVSVFNSNHFGIAGYYAVRGVAADMICWAMTNTPALVAPLWGVGRMLGTNPLAVAFPAQSAPPVVVDLATSAVSLGVVENALRSGAKVPTGCIVDAEGSPTTEPEKFHPGGSLLPLGGDREHGGHKGYCLAALIDILCGVLSGANWGPFVPPFPHNINAPERQVGQGLGHLFGAFRIGAFADPEEFKRRMDEWIDALRATPAAPGTRGVQIPGDPERAAAADSVSNGVPVEKTVVEDLSRLASQLGLRFQ